MASDCSLPGQRVWNGNSVEFLAARGLFVDDRQQCVTSLVRMQAGLSTHRHEGPEEVYHA